MTTKVDQKVEKIIVAISIILKYMPALGTALGQIAEKNVGKLFFSALEDFIFSYEKIDNASLKDIMELGIEELNGYTLLSIYNKAKATIELAKSLDENLKFFGKGSTGWFSSKDTTVVSKPEELLKELGLKK